MRTPVSLIICMLLFLPSTPCIAYSCREEIRVPELYAENEAAFIGRVKRKMIDFSFTSNKYVLEVVSSKKGDLSNELVVWTVNKSKCGAHFIVGEEFVVFSKVIGGRHWTDMNSSWRIYENNMPRTQEYLAYEEGE